MTRKEIIDQLQDLKVYCLDTCQESDIDDIWCKDALALIEGIKLIETATYMLADIFENLSGKDEFAEMISILSKKGYEPNDFEQLGICTSQEVEECIEIYNN